MATTTAPTHDYVDFVQQNGSGLKVLELLESAAEEKEATEETEETEDTESWGSDEAVLIIVPEDLDLSKTSLSDLDEYETVETNYSSTDREFEDLPGYRDHLASEKKGEHRAVWKHPKYPGKKLIVFEPQTYECFVEGKCDTDLVPLSYYRFVWALRRKGLPAENKDELFQRVVDQRY